MRLLLLVLLGLDLVDAEPGRVVRELAEAVGRHTKCDDGKSVLSGLDSLLCGGLVRGLEVVSHFESLSSRVSL